MSYIKGTKFLEEELFGCQVQTVEIQNKRAANKVGKKIGQYITITTPFPLDQGIEITEAGECLATVLDRVLRLYYQRKLCICGMGNWSVPADSLGPEVMNALSLKYFSTTGVRGAFRDVCALAPGTSLSSNVDTEIIVNGFVKTVGADCVLLVDALVTDDPSHLFQTIQISTSGELHLHLSERNVDWAPMGIPVISLGVPLAIPLSALSTEMGQSSTLLTSINIKDIVSAAAIIIAYAINRVCWPSLSKEECFLYAKCNRDPVPYSNLLIDKQDDNNLEDEHIQQDKAPPCQQADGVEAIMEQHNEMNGQRILFSGILADIPPDEKLVELFPDPYHPNKASVTQFGLKILKLRLEGLDAEQTAEKLQITRNRVERWSLDTVRMLTRKRPDNIEVDIPALRKLLKIKPYNFTEGYMKLSELLRDMPPDEVLFQLDRERGNLTGGGNRHRVSNQDLYILQQRLAGRTYRSIGQEFSMGQEAMRKRIWRIKYGLINHLAVELDVPGLFDKASEK